MSEQHYETLPLQNNQGFLDIEHSNIYKQIKAELQASHIYYAYAHYFNHPKVALPGFHKYFMKQSKEELEHADAFIGFMQNTSGYFASPALLPAKIPLNPSPLVFLQLALNLEKDILSSLIELHDKGDLQTQVFVEDYINHQTKAIGEATALVTKAERLDSPQGIYLLDRELLI